MTAARAADDDDPFFGVPRQRQGQEQLSRVPLSLAAFSPRMSRFILFCRISASSPQMGQRPTIKPQTKSSQSAANHFLAHVKWPVGRKAKNLSAATADLPFGWPPWEEGRKSPVGPLQPKISRRARPNKSFTESIFFVGWQQQLQPMMTTSTDWMGRKRHKRGLHG